MVADSELSNLGELLEDVAGQLGTEDSQAILKAIFAANNEIGRLSRARGDLRDSLVGLQAEVNLVTVRVKSGTFAGAREAFMAVEKTFGRIASSRASGKEFIERRGPETN